MIDLSQWGFTTVLQRTGFATQFRELLVFHNEKSLYAVRQHTRNWLL